MPTEPTTTQHPAELLSRLIQFDTSNPPGNEKECILYLRELLTAAGIDARLLAKDERRPNLVAWIHGGGEAPPLLIYGHIDVVSTEGQEWSREPFGGEIADGYVWGRGALDMKGGVAMLVSAFLKVRAGGKIPAGDVILALVVDEEVEGEFGAAYLVDEHAELFAGVHYAISEFGGFNLDILGKRFYPIQVTEKQTAVVTATVKGKGGHGSGFVQDTAMVRAGRLMERLNHKWLPVRVTPTVAEMIRTVSRVLPKPLGMSLGLLLNPKMTDLILRRLRFLQGFFVPQFHNVVNPTMIRGGEKVNVIPAEVAIQIDARSLPGVSPDEVIDEIRDVIQDDGVELAIRSQPLIADQPDMGMFEMLAGILKEMDPEGHPIPMMLPAASDARHFNKLGIQTYGFTPMKLPPEIDFLNLIHAADERVPIEALEFGTEAIYTALTRYSG